MRVREVVVPGELDQPANRGRGLEVLEAQGLFGLADVGVGLLEDREEQVVLAAEVVVQQALVDAGALGDALDPRTAEPGLRELGDRRIQDGLLGAVGIAGASLRQRDRKRRHACIIH